MTNKNIFTITPSWLIKKKSDFKQGIKNLEKFGFNIINKDFISKLPSDKQKANLIHKAFLNKKADIVLAHRGGYGSMRVMPLINFNLIKRNPKIFAGFSDISTLLNTIFERTGIITLHSPMILNFSNASKFTVKSFLNAINNFPQKDLFRNTPLKVFKSGVTGGVLKGGNLITLTALLGTNWEVKTQNAVLFFEEVDEKLHGIDRCLSHWILKRKFDNIKALILGNFRNVNINDVYKILSSQIKIKFPVVHSPFIGHVVNKITLPVGANIELNTYRKSLTIK